MVTRVGVVGGRAPLLNVAARIIYSSLGAKDLVYSVLPWAMVGP